MTLCEYDDEEAAKKAEHRGLGLIGSRTGVALARDKTLLVIADKDNIDPSGRVLNKVSKLFWDVQGG